MLPGTYRVSAAQLVEDTITPLGEPQSFEVVSIVNPTLPRQDPASVLAFQVRVGELTRAAEGVRDRISEVLEQLQAVKPAVRQTKGVDLTLLAETRALELELLDAREALTGDQTAADRGESSPPSILRRLRSVQRGSYGNSYGPTGTHRRDLAIARQEFETVTGALRKLTEEAIPTLHRKLEAAGVPWTAGRPMPALKK